MKEYDQIEFEIIRFETEDVIATSCNPDTTDNGGED